MAQPKKGFPFNILILSVITMVFGFGMGLIIINSHSAADSPIVELPTSSVRQLTLNSTAPDFTLRTLSGQAVSLDSFRGRRVLVNFWASWCGPCQLETPDLERAYKQLRQQNVVFVGIGTGDETARLKQFVADHGVTYTIVEDPEGTVSDSYGVVGLPSTFLIDSKGFVRKEYTGPVTAQQVLADMAQLN